MTSHLDETHKDITTHVERLDDEKHENHGEVNALQDAIAAEHAEHELGVVAALRQYKAAVFWSIMVSMCIVSPCAMRSDLYSRSWKVTT